jgi:glutamyl endopeptidase
VRPPVVVLLVASGVLAVVLASSPTAAQPAPNAVSSVQGPVVVDTPPLPDAGQSHAPEAVTSESVINVDDRSRVTDTTAYPSSAIGLLELRAGGSAFRCTAFLVDRNTALTSGHCVHEGGTGASDPFYTDHVFTPGRNGAGSPFGSCGTTELWTLPGWYDGNSEYQDLGILQLDCDIGETVGWFGYFALPGRHDLEGFRDHLRGYPGDKPFGTMWTDRKQIRVSQGQMVFYRNDTFGGQSGSPVFQWGSHCAGPCAMAVHGYGWGHDGRPHHGNNHGPRIDVARWDLIASIAAQNG